MNSEHPPLLLIPGFPHILHGGDYNPEQWLGTPEVLAEDRRLRKLAGCNAFSVGIFSWSHLEPEEGRFEFGWMDRVMDELAEDGCRAILATPTAGRPPWMARRYPEVMRVNRAGTREPYGTRHNFCWSSPVFREKTLEIVSRLAERYKNHPALGMWHVSNELGGNEGNGECLCPRCLEEWRGWLRGRYGSLGALNEAWWGGFWAHRFSDWEEIVPTDPTLDACALDWSRFVNWQMREWFGFEASIIRPVTPDVPITTNFMGVHSWIDYEEFGRVVDVVADDQYPGIFHSRENLEGAFLACAFKHDWMRCFRPGRPWMLMESCPETPQWLTPQALKHEHLHRAEMLQAIGHGAEGTCYFQWRKGRGGIEKLHGAIVDHSGSERTRTFQIVRRLSETYRRLGPVLGSRRAAEVALLYDHDSRRALELTSGAPHGGMDYLHFAQEIYRPFWRRGVAVDVMDSRREGWESKKLVLVPHLYLLHPGVAERLAGFVENGGVLAGTCLTGCVDDSARCLLGGWPGGGLRKIFGVWMEELDALGKDRRLEVTGLPGWGGLSGQCSRLAGVTHPEGAEALAVFAGGEDIPCGHPAILRNKHGRGQLWYLAGEFDRDLIGALANIWIEEAGIAAPFAAPLPEGVIFSGRTGGEHDFWFFSNITAGTREIPLPCGSNTEVLAGPSEALNDTILRLPPRSDLVVKNFPHAGRLPTGTAG